MQKRPGKRDVERVRKWKVMDQNLFTRDFDGLGKIIEFCLSVVDDANATTRERVDAAREAREAIMYQLELQTQALERMSKTKSGDGVPEAEAGDFSAGMYS